MVYSRKVRFFFSVVYEFWHIHFEIAVEYPHRQYFDFNLSQILNFSNGVSVLQFTIDEIGLRFVPQPIRQIAGSKNLQQRPDHPVCQFLSQVFVPLTKSNHT